VTIGAGDSLLQWLVLPRLPQVRRVLRGSIAELRDLQNLLSPRVGDEEVVGHGMMCLSRCENKVTPRLFAAAVVLGPVQAPTGRDSECRTSGSPLCLA
jgi:hypothetical protein